MASSRTRALLTQSETDLVAASRPAALKRLSEQRLRTNAARARNLRDKYQDLARRQRLEARGKTPRARARPVQDNARTVRKAEVFAKALERFQRKLAGVGTRGARTRPGGGTARSSPPARAAARRRDTRKSRRKVAQAVRASAKASRSRSRR